MRPLSFPIIRVPHAVAQGDVVVALAELADIPGRVAEQPRRMQQVTANSAGLLLGVLAPLAADLDALIEGAAARTEHTPELAVDGAKLLN